MPRFGVLAELNGDGSLAKISTEVATLARALAEGSGGEAVGLVVAAEPDAAAKELARFLPRVLAVTEPAAAGRAWAAIAAERAAPILAGAGEDDIVLLGAGPDGRDAAGALAALSERGVLANATAVRWDGRLQVEMSAFGGKLITTSGFTGAGGGIVTIRPNMLTAEPSGSAGTVEEQAPAGELALPVVSVKEQVVESGVAAPIEEARIIVSGGRGIGGEEGFGLVEELAAALGGAVGATRAAVDSGWIPYAQQIGQTGKIVKPQLYLALGISGAIQHKVGMQTAGTIVAVNRDPDAPIGEFADLMVVGDLFAVVPALLAELRARGS